MSRTLQRGSPAGDDASTPLSDAELAELVPSHITTRGELSQWEVLNIARAQERLSRRRARGVLRVEFLRELHVLMFGDTWERAGSYRREDDDVSPYPWTSVSVLVRNVVEHTRARYEASDRTAPSIDQLATRFHHELARVHPWAHGNGRHARLATDLLLADWGRPPFTWGRGAGRAAARGARSAYLESLRRADRGDLSALGEFVRS